MADFTGEDLAGSRFEDVDLAGARFRRVDLTRARFHLVDLTGATIRGASLVDVDISGELRDVRVNGVDVVPLVEAELDRRYPERVMMRPDDADGFRGGMGRRRAAVGRDGRAGPPAGAGAAPRAGRG